MDWFKWYPEKYKRNTMHLTAEQDGIYRRLIDHYMEMRRPLPNNILALARIAAVSEQCMSNAWVVLQAYFKQTSSNELAHETCDNQLNEQDKGASFRSERAKKAADARHKKDKENKNIVATSNATSMLGDARVKSQDITIDKSIVNIIQHPDEKNRFGEFWELYPAKKEKLAASKAYQKTQKNGVTHETIIAGLNRYIQHLANSDQYVKNPATWLNKGCWADEYPTVTARNNPTRQAFNQKPSAATIAMDARFAEIQDLQNGAQDSGLPL
jgi:uncharacterized protein YdaU (DUF1376 family)